MAGLAGLAGLQTSAIPYGVVVRLVRLVRPANTLAGLLAGARTWPPIVPRPTRTTTNWPHSSGGWATRAVGPDAIRRTVLDAIARGDIPAGGPSELAARDLVDDAPARYWQRWSDDAAARISEQTRRYAALPADEPSADDLEPEPARRRRNRRARSDDARIMYAPRCQRCGRSRRYGETFGGPTGTTAPASQPAVTAILVCRHPPATARIASITAATVTGSPRSSTLSTARCSPGSVSRAASSATRGRSVTGCRASGSTTSS